MPESEDWTHGYPPSGDEPTKSATQATVGDQTSVSLETLKNHRESDLFVEAVGRLLLNMGVIEHQSIEWVNFLQTDPMVREITKSLPLGRRIDIVKKLIERNKFLTEKERSQCIDLWSLVLPHAQVRNIVSHNPVFMAFPDNDPSREAVVSGVLNLKPKNKNRDAELISVEEINGSVNATARIGQQLLDLTDMLAKKAPNTGL